MDSNITSNRSLQATYVAFLANLCCGFIGFILNISVCLIISTHSILRQPFNFLILNLSLTDLLVSCAIMLNGVSDYFSASRLISYGAFSILCHINIGFIVVSLPAACLTLLIISIERYQAIAAVRFHKVQLSTVCKVIPIIWLLAIITAIIPIVYAESDVHYPYECTMGRIDHFNMLILLLVSCFITCILPIGMMLIAYVMIFYKVIHDLPVVQPTSSLVISRREKHLRHSILPVLCISIFSIISGIPFLVITCYISVNQYYKPSFRAIFVQQHYLLWVATNILFIMTLVINPLLYNLASGQFRKVLHSLLCDHRCSLFKNTTPIEPIQARTCKSSTAHLQTLSTRLPSTKASVGE